MNRTINLYNEVEVYDAPYQMAIDEVLLNKVEAGEASAILRIYSFAPGSITIGRCQKIVETQDLEAKISSCSSVTRRLTGGGAVYHDSHLTYTLISSFSFHESFRDVNATYKVIHHSLLKLFATYFDDLGLHKQSSSSFSGTQSCFDQPVNDDIVVNSVKIAGAAQKRFRNSFIHQGSIDLQPFETIDKFSLDTLSNRLEEVFSKLLSADLNHVQLLDSDKIEANSLVCNRYSLSNWINRM